MKIKTIFISILLVFALPAFTNAQIGNLLKNKAAKVINAGTKTLSKEVDKEIDTAAQKGVQNAREKAYENMEQNKDEAGQEEANQTGDKGAKGFNLGGLIGGKVTSKYNDSYSFNNRIYMQMELYDKKDVAKMDYFIYFSDTNPNGGFESKLVGTAEDGSQVALITSSVFDGENKVFLILTDMGTMKIGMISDIPDESTLNDQPAANTPKPTITKTGNSKVIAGYKCDEYLYNEGDSKKHGVLWVTKDLRLKADKRTYSKAGLPSYYSDPQLENGFVLAMESYSEKNELEMKSETIEINMNYDHSISTAGYSLRQINFNQAQGQKKK